MEPLQPVQRHLRRGRQGEVEEMKLPGFSKEYGGNFKFFSCCISSFARGLATARCPSTAARTAWERADKRRLVIRSTARLRSGQSGPRSESVQPAADVESRLGTLGLECCKPN